MNGFSRKWKELFAEDSRQLIFYGAAIVFVVFLVWFVIYAASFLASSLDAVFGVIPVKETAAPAFDIAGFERLNLNQ